MVDPSRRLTLSAMARDVLACSLLAFTCLAMCGAAVAEDFYQWPTDPAWRMGAVKAGIKFPAHEGKIIASSLTSDGGSLVTSGVDKTVKLWNCQDGKLLHTLQEAGDGTGLFATISRDNQFVLVGFDDGNIRLWKLATGELAKTFKTETEVNQLAWAPDGKKFASCGKDQNLLIWSIKEDQPINKDYQHIPVSAMEFSLDGKYVMMGLPPHGIGHFDIEQTQPAEWLVNPAKELVKTVDDLVFMPDGKNLCYTCDGALVQFTLGPRGKRDWLKIVDGNTYRTSQHQHVRVACSKDGKSLVTFTGQGSVQAGDPMDRGRLFFSPASEDGVTSTALSADGIWGAACNDQGVIHLWQIAEVPPSGIDQIVAFMDRVKAHFAKQEYAELDAMAAALIKERPRTGRGDRVLTYFYAAFEEGAIGEQAHVERIEEVQKWVEARPDSGPARTILGMLHVCHAWDARGTGFAITVGPEAMQQYAERLVEAREHLTRAVELSPKDPENYRWLINVEKGIGDDKEAVYELLEAAIAADPEYYATYAGMTEYLLPRWHGEPGELGTFADGLKERMDLDIAKRAYFMIAARAIRYEGPTVFQSTGLTYERALEGGQNLVDAFPGCYQSGSVSTLNQLAHMACTQLNRDDARKYFGLLGRNYLDALWGNHENYDRMETWANQPEADPMATENE